MNTPSLPGIDSPQSHCLYRHMGCGELINIHIFLVMYSYEFCLSFNGCSLLVPQNLCYYYDWLNMNLCCHEKAPRFIEFQILPVVALTGPGQRITQAIYGPQAGHSCSKCYKPSPLKSFPCRNLTDWSTGEDSALGNICLRFFFSADNLFLVDLAFPRHHHPHLPKEWSVNPMLSFSANVFCMTTS